MPNKLSKFWQELKRRNVTRVLAVYIAAAFMILELINMISEPLGLPEGTLIVAFFISLTGLVLAVIVSWIYDIQPEVGVVKTEKADTANTRGIPKTSSSWKIASYISFVVILGLIVLNIIPRARVSGTGKNFDKSIAVLPFDNDSPTYENAFLIKGYMTAVHDNLCKIKDIRVLALNATEHYNNQTKSIPVIAQELGVGYFLSARGQIINDKIRLTVQLVDANNNVIWSSPYDRQIKEVVDHIKIQSEIAQMVAGEIKATITPFEKELIEKIPTNSTEAYNYYLRGREEVVINSGFYRTTDSRSKAKNLFHRSLELDSTFALAYAGLGWVYMYENESEIKYLGVHSDSALYFVQKALSYDDQLSDAYEIRGDYYRLAGDFDLSEADLKRAIDINPNSWSAYRTIATLYINYQYYILGLSSMHKAASLCTGEMLERILTSIGGLYAQLGFRDLAKSYFTQVLNLNGDSVAYFIGLSFMEWNNGNNQEQLNYEIKVSSLNPSAARDLNIGRCYYLLNDFERALAHYEKYLEDKGESTGELFENYYRLAYAYSQLGLEDRAKYFFNKQTEICIEAEKTGSYYFISGQGQYDLAGVYAATGQITKSLDYLRMVNQIKTYPAWGYHLIKIDPILDSIRDDPEFQQILHDIEAKYQAQHEKIRQLLEENDML